MGEWLQSLPVGWMALVIFTLTYLGAWFIFAVVGSFARRGLAGSFKGVSPGMLPPLGIIFGLQVAFVASQVWNDIDHAQTAVNREASALSTVISLAASFPGEPESRLRELTRRHLQDAVAYEWPMMAEQSNALAVTPVPLAEELQFILSVVPHSEGQRTAQREIVAALEAAIDARRQRIIVSHSSVNWVKWTALLLQAICTLAAIAMIHSENRGAGIAALGIFATGIAVSILLIASHDRPFTGEISVKSDLFRQVMREESATQDGIDHTVLLHLTALLRSARQVVAGRHDRLDGKKLIEQVRAEYAAQTGHPLPDLDQTSAEGRMIQAELDAMRETLDEAGPGLHPSVFADRVAESFNRKVGQLGYLRLTAPAERLHGQPDSPDTWEDRTIRSKFQSAAWKKGDVVEEETQLNGRKAYRLLIPEYYEASCPACVAEAGGKTGDLGGAISAAIYLK